jgi:hypothetical protein
MPRIAPRLPELRSPVARAVAPVVGGVFFFGVLGLVLWGVAAWLADSNTEVRLGDPVFEISRIDKLADSITKDGPQLYPDLKDPSGRRSVVVAHEGTNDAEGWIVYRPFPFDRAGETCFATQTPKTRKFVDCENRVLDVTQLHLANDVAVSLKDGRVLVLTFAGAVAPTTSVAG